MSKKILPFPLAMKNGAKVRTIEDLRANADIETIVSAYLDGKLNRWCKAFHYDNIPDKLAEVTEAMIWQIYETLGIPLEQADVDAYLAENASLQGEAVGTVSAEAEIVDCSDIKAKLTEYISSDINLDDYAIESAPIVNEEGQVNQYKVVIQNKTTKMYCSFFMPFTPADNEEAKEKWSQNLCSNIANAMQKMKEITEYNIEDHSQNLKMETKDNTNTKIKKSNSERELIIQKSDDFIFVEGNDTVSDFYICDHPVTQAEYESIMGNNPSMFSGDNNPVENVSWYDAVKYCNKRSEKEGLTPYYDIVYRNPKKADDKDKVTPNESANGYRLPTRNEWQYAAKGGNKSEGYKYSGSDYIDDVAWYNDNSDYETHPVKEKEPNELDLYDMNGNVWEWCVDINCNGSRCCCGGSCNSYDEGTNDFLGMKTGKRVSDVRFNESHAMYYDLGFRVVRSAK